MGNLNWDRCRVADQMRGPTEDSRGYGDHVPSLKRKRARRRRSKSTMLSCGCSVEGSLTYEQLLEAQASHCCPDL